MKEIKGILLVARTGLQRTFTDSKSIVLLIIIGFILDSGVRGMTDNAIAVGEPLGFTECFLMCINEGAYAVIFLAGFLFILSDVPRLDSSQIFLIYRTGKRNWLFGETLQVAVGAFLYTLLLFLGSIAASARYSFVGNTWSNFTVFYKKYREMLSGSRLNVHERVYKYHLPYQAALHGFLLLFLCMVVMGTAIIFFSVIGKKAAGIVLNMVMVMLVLLFNEHRSMAMWVSPFCHAVLALHNVYVYRRLSVPLYWSYLYLAALEGLLLFLSLRKLERKMFY